MDYLSFYSNNHGTQSSNQVGILEAETIFHNQVPMEIEGEIPPHSNEGQEE
jgi:hypothetical protein